MNKIEFYGSIYSDNYKIVASIFKKWLLTDNLDIKIRIMGEEIVYDSDKVYLYCYNASIGKRENPFFLLEGNMYETLEEGKFLLQQLFNLFQEANIVSKFECAEVNENGDEISEQLYISQ